MKEIKLELVSNDSNEIQEYLKEQFQFPDYYGMNLDALNDCLGEICEETLVEIIYDESDEYHKRVLKVFRDACQENEDLKLVVVEE